MNPDWDGEMKARAREAGMLGAFEEAVNREIRRRVEALTEEQFDEVAQEFWDKPPSAWRQVVLRALGVPDA